MDCERQNARIWTLLPFGACCLMRTAGLRQEREASHREQAGNSVRTTSPRDQTTSVVRTEMCSALLGDGCCFKTVNIGIEVRNEEMP